MIRNCTQFKIKIKGDAYWDSGRYEECPTPTIDPFSIGTFTGVNKDYEWTGATGGQAYTLNIESDTKLDLSLVSFQLDVIPRELSFTREGLH